MTKTSFQKLLVCSALTALSCAALSCGGDDADSTPEDRKPDSGTNTQSDAKAPNVSSDASAGGPDASRPGDSGGGKPADSGTTSSFFSAAPACNVTTGGSQVNIKGKLSTFDVDYTDSAFSSDLIPGKFDTLDAEGDDVLHYLSFTWSGGLQPGEVRGLTGAYLALPDTSTDGAGPFCIVAGEFASVPSSDAPAAGALLNFHITKIKARSSRLTNGATCQGPELDADLRGCIYRTNSFLP